MSFSSTPPSPLLHHGLAEPPARGDEEAEPDEDEKDRNQFYAFRHSNTSIRARGA